MADRCYKILCTYEELCTIMTALRLELDRNEQIGKTTDVALLNNAIDAAYKWTIEPMRIGDTL